MSKKFTSLDGSSWTQRSARAGFPILVEYAQAGRSITYKDWDREIIDRGLGEHTFLPQYGRPAGVIGDACAEFAEATGSNVPAINLIVVDQTGVPGNGADYYIEEFARTSLNRSINPQQLSLPQKKAIIDEAHAAIFAFSDWTSVLAAFGLRPTDRLENEQTKKRLPKPNPASWHTGPESEEHKKLKHLIAATPQLINLPAEIGQEEHLLWSGDEVDVYFENAKVGVEVKSKRASWSELHRGIFQCVKYRAVLKAQQVHDRLIPTADCFLATGGQLPNDLVELATRLKVRFFHNLDPEL